MGQLVRQMFINTRNQNALEGFSDWVADNYRPEFYFFRQYDYSGNFILIKFKLKKLLFSR